MAYYNIRQLQIDQHRAWMLRTWVYLGEITTIRIIMISSASIITMIGSYDTTKECGEIRYLYTKSETYNATQLPLFLKQRYPACAAGNSNTRVVVVASTNQGPENIGAALGLSFAMAFWLAIIIHALGIEIYLWLTPAEAERLRMRSYERQIGDGLKNLGSSGLTSDRWGDAPARRPGRSPSIQPIAEK